MMEENISLSVKAISEDKRKTSSRDDDRFVPSNNHELSFVVTAISKNDVVQSKEDNHLITSSLTPHFPPASCNEYFQDAHRLPSPPPVRRVCKNTTSNFPTLQSLMQKPELTDLNEISDEDLNKSKT